MPLDLEAIRARWQGIGPWFYRVGAGRNRTDIVERLGEDWRPIATLAKGLDTRREEAVRSGPTDIPALIADLTTARAMLADALGEAGRLREALAAIRDYGMTVTGGGPYFPCEPIEGKRTCDYAKSCARAALEGRQP